MHLPDDLKKAVNEIMKEKKCSSGRAFRELVKRQDEIGEKARRRQRKNLQMWDEFLWMVKMFSDDE